MNENDDEIVRELRESLPPKIDYAELVGAEGFAHGAYYVLDDPLPYLMSNAADLIESLQAQITASKRREQAAVEKSILWGADLITENTDAHVIFCAECGYPIADYGVDEDVSCAMCKAKNHSHNYAPGGPGYCRTTVDRRAKVYDKLFSSGPQEAEKGEAE